MTADVSRADPTPTAQTAVEARLNGTGIAAIEVGRWTSADGDHVALLTADEDAVAARTAARPMPGTTAHVLTTSGSRSGSFRLDNPEYSSITIAIFPFDLAGALLARSKAQAGLDALDRFRVAAYVATYFRSFGRLVGFDDQTGPIALGALAKAASIDPAQYEDRAALDGYLAEIGWRPSIDMLERLGLADAWIESELLPQLVGDKKVAPGLSIFFCRATAVDMGYTPEMQAAIEDMGFEILKSLPLDDGLINEIRSATRGGNWGAGPFPKGGGPPTHLLFAVDVFPSRPDPTLLRQHPFLDNSRTLEAKFAARDAVFRSLSPDERFNPMHSSDNSTEAMRIAADVLSPADFANLAEVFTARMGTVDAMRDEAEPLSGRSRVTAHFLLRRGPKRRLRKIYRPQHAAHADRTAQLQTTLATLWSEFPAILSQGDGYLDFEDPGDAFVPLAGQKLPARVATVLNLRRLLRTVAEAGFRPDRWDLDQGVFISTETGELRIAGIDRLDENVEPKKLTDIVPSDASGSGQPDTYATFWYPVLGMPRWMFLQSGPVTMYLYRWLFFYFRNEALRLVATIKTAVRRRAKPLRARLLRRR